MTYSCEKRTSHRAKNASPGCTAVTPTRSVRASTIACCARIFSQRVIGRGDVVIAGGVVFPARRALLYAKSPPCSTMEALMASSPLVNSSIGMASPRWMRGTRDRSVLVSRPMFWAFWR